jgi:purine-binding chemotaxis protein CheW
MDLRRRFKLDEALGAQACIITVALQRDGVEALVGLLVDGVSEVAGVKADEIEALPSVGAASGADEVLGLIKAQGKVRILLDIDKVVGSADLAVPSAA